MAEESLWVAIIVLGILLALACEPRMAAIFLLGGASALLAARCGLLPSRPLISGGAPAAEGFAPRRSPPPASYEPRGSQQIPLARSPAQAPEAQAPVPPLAPTPVPPHAHARSTPLAPYPGDIDLDEPEPRAPPGWWEDEGALARDGDEKAAGQARWRNDPNRPIEGVLRRRRDLDPILRDELDEDGEREWWGRHET